MHERTWQPSWPCAAGRILSSQRRGVQDPTYRVVAGVHWRGLQTPEGPATLAVEQSSSHLVRARAWGQGAEWSLESVPSMLGADDDVSGFDPIHPGLIEGWRQSPNWRFGRTGLIMQSLIPTIIEQRVTGQEAFGGYRSLVRRHGEPAPGPVSEMRLMVPPTADTVRMIPSWEWLQLHIDPARSRAIVRACQVATALERAGRQGPEALDRALRSIPGIGVWSSAEVRRLALGDPDAVSFGDYHIAKDVGWAMTGTPFSDEELAEFLEPWRPQRARVVALIGHVAGHRPRRGPRMAPRTHLPSR